MLGDLSALKCMTDDPLNVSAPVMDNPPFALLPQGYYPVVGTSSSTEKKIRGLVLAIFLRHVVQSHDKQPRNACSWAKSPRRKKKMQEQLHNDLGKRSHGGGSHQGWFDAILGHKLPPFWHAHHPACNSA